jgi:hypothetical protein
LHVNPKVVFEEDSLKSLKSLVQSSRIFQELEFVEGSDDYLKKQEKFEFLEEYLGFTGSHIKKLKLSEMKVDFQILLNLLNLLPNLEDLELSFAVISSNEAIKLDLKSTKIQRIQMYHCTGLENFFVSLEQCKIKELEFSLRSQVKSQVLQKFLKSQEKNLKKLIIPYSFHWLNDLKDLRLEYLDFFSNHREVVSLEFLKQQVDLKFFRFHNLVYDGIVDVILELENLEGLELEGWVSDGDLDDLHRLEKLKRLKVYRDVSRNILDHMEFGVYNNLEELDAHFEGASEESILELKWITPNLKKIAISSASSRTINALLETLENLEAVKIQTNNWRMTGKYPKIKHLHINCRYDFRLNALQITQRFPNLVYLWINNCPVIVTVSFFIEFLSRLQQLKTLYMEIESDLVFNREQILQCLQEHGKHLGDAKIVFRFPDLKTEQEFAIEKRLRDIFCINLKDTSLYSSWMRGVF